MKRVIFMGTPEYAEKILLALIAAEDMEVVAVFTRPDKPVGRKKILTPPPVKVAAQEAGIECYQPEKLRDSVDAVVAIACDFIVVAAYGQILPKAILDHAPCINLHASVLPRYRGASPIQQSLLNGDSETGVTAMLMDEGLDTGAILKIERTEIPQDMTAQELFETLTDIAVDLTLDVLRSFEHIDPVAQNDAEASYCKKITKADGLVDFTMDATDIYNRYRAFIPWPGIFLENGLKLKKIALVDKENTHDATGKIIAIDKEGATVTCKRGSLKLLRVQPPSKKEVDVIGYLNGARRKVADNFA